MMRKTDAGRGTKPIHMQRSTLHAPRRVVVQKRARVVVSFLAEAQCDRREGVRPSSRGTVGRLL